MNLELIPDRPPLALAPSPPTMRKRWPPQATVVARKGAASGTNRKATASVTASLAD